MPVTVTNFEDTPNPNAVKCWLDATISDRPLSFFNAEQAASHPLAHQLFTDAGAINVLINGDWITVNKSPAARWPAIRTKIQSVLKQYEVPTP